MFSEQNRDVEVYCVHLLIEAQGFYFLKHFFREASIFQARQLGEASIRDGASVEECMVS